MRSKILITKGLLSSHIQDMEMADALSANGDKVEILSPTEYLESIQTARDYILTSTTASGEPPYFSDKKKKGGPKTYGMSLKKNKKHFS